MVTLFPPGQMRRSALDPHHSPAHTLSSGEFGTIALMACTATYGPPSTAPYRYMGIYYIYLSLLLFLIFFYRKHVHLVTNNSVLWRALARKSTSSDRLRKPTSSDRQQANFLIASGEANFLSSRVSSNNQPQSHIQHPCNHYDWRKVHTFFAHRRLVIEAACETCVSRA